MSAADKHICYNCFQETAGGGGSCPCCGFDLAENERKYPTALRAGTVLNQRYIAGRVLGQGGFGITYLAWDRNLDTKVAVKEYLPGELADRTEGGKVSVMSADRLDEFTYGAERFKEEAAVLAKFMGQPGIAGVTDRFDENGTSYFVMDYIEGISFKTYIANAGGKISPQEAMDVMIPVLRALTAVHGEGLIHRDVTPDNIYITKDGNVKLLDFGSARYSMGDKSKSLDVILKVGYAPKEQYIRRGRQGPYTDVYSCAACLYAAITGYLPPESLERLDHDTLIPPSEAGAEIPLYLERAILKGLAVQPEDRFQTAEEFLNALEGQQVVFYPEAPETGRQKERRERKPAGRKVPLFSALLGGAAAIAIFFTVVSMAGRERTEDPHFSLAAEEDRKGSLSGQDGSLPSAEEKPISNGISTRLERTIREAQGINGEIYNTAQTELILENAELAEEDYEAISQMTDLERLEIQVNSPLSQLDFLKNLTNLKRLHIRANGESAGTFSDLSALAGLTNMEDLYLYLDGISDLSGLSGMSRLKSLVLTGNMEISDLSPLAELTNLQTLEVPGSSENVGIDLTPLAGLTNLRSLRTGSNVTDLAPLSGMTELRDLDLTYGGYSANGAVEYESLAPLASLTKLNTLTIRNLKVSDLSPLAGLSDLKSLTIHNGASIRDLSPLAGLSDLKSLTIQGARHELDTSALSQVSKISVEP